MVLEGNWIILFTIFSPVFSSKSILLFLIVGLQVKQQIVALTLPIQIYIE